MLPPPQWSEMFAIAIVPEPLESHGFEVFESVDRYVIDKISNKIDIIPVLTYI